MYFLSKDFIITYTSVYFHGFGRFVRVHFWITPMEFLPGKDRQAFLGLHSDTWPNKLTWRRDEEGESQPLISSKFSALYFAFFCLVWFCFQRHPLLEPPLVLPAQLLAQMSFDLCEMTPGGLLFCLLRSGRFVTEQFLQKLWRMKISILCISIQKRCWEEAKQNISQVFSFSPNLKLEKSIFIFCFQLENRAFASTFCAHANVKKYFLQGESNRLSTVQNAEDLLGSFLFMRENIVMLFLQLLPLFFGCFCGFSYTGGNTKPELFHLETELAQKKKKKENPGLVSSCCLES